MKSYLVFFCLFYTPIIISQPDNQKDFSFDFVSSIDRVGIDHNFVTTDITGKPLSNFGVCGKYNFRIGGDVSFNLSDGLYLRTGIRYARLGYSSFSITDDDETEAGMSETKTTTSTFDDIFIELPILLRFEAAQSKFQPYLELGMSNNLYVKSIVSTKTYDYDTTSEFDASEGDEAFNKLQTSVIISYGFNYVWNEQFKLFCQSTYRYHLDKVSKNPLSYRFYSFGVEFGVRRLIDLGKSKKGILKGYS